MEPVRTEATTEVPPADTGSTLVVGAEVATAIALAAVVGFVLNRGRLPQPDLRRALPEDLSTELPAVAETASLRAMFQSALARSRSVLQAGLDRVFGKPLDPAGLEQLEEALLQLEETATGVSTEDEV